MNGNEAIAFLCNGLFEMYEMWSDFLKINLKKLKVSEEDQEIQF